MNDTLQELARDASATATAFRLFIILAGLQEQDWTPPLSPADLARELCAGPRTVERAVRWLVARGYLQRSYVGGRRGGRLPRYGVAIRSANPSPGRRGV